MQLVTGDRLQHFQSKMYFHSAMNFGEGINLKLIEAPTLIIYLLISTNTKFYFQKAKLLDRKSIEEKQSIKAS